MICCLPVKQPSFQHGRLEGFTSHQVLLISPHLGPHSQPLSPAICLPAINSLYDASAVLSPTHNSRKLRPQFFEESTHEPVILCMCATLHSSISTAAISGKLVSVNTTRVKPSQLSLTDRGYCLLPNCCSTGRARPYYMRCI